MLISEKKSILTNNYVTKKGMNLFWQQIDSDLLDELDVENIVDDFVTKYAICIYDLKYPRGRFHFNRDMKSTREI